VQALLVENLRKSFGKGERVVNDVSFNVSAGEVFAFLGPNGAGKTTTIKMVRGCWCRIPAPCASTAWTRIATHVR